MSDSEGDFDDELLELAGASEKKRKSRSSSSKSGAKRRKADTAPDSDDGDDYESEEDDSNPYPLEGKFIDEADRLKLLDLPEVEREEIISQRMEEMQRLQDKRNLDQMLRVQRGESDNVSKAAKRAHAVRGATKEKSRKLDELKAKRKAKVEKKRVKADSPKRERSSSPMDMEMSDDDEEDGQISKLEQEEEREARLLSKFKPDEDPQATLEDLELCQLSRDALCKYSKRTWFEEYAKGCWVRYLIGNDKGDSVYRICEIIGLGPNSTKSYTINDEQYDQQLLLRHGKAVKTFPMDRVSNSRFHIKEYERLAASHTADKVKMPLKRDLEKKHAQMQPLLDQRLTESDISAMLARKQNQYSSRMSSAMSTMERSRLMQELKLARKRHDFEEVQQLEERLKEFNVEANGNDTSTKEIDPLALVNERNRKANLEAVRRAEAENAERRRRDRKAALTASRPGTPGDQSARIKTTPRHLDDSRNASPKASPLLAPTLGIDSHNAATRSVSPLPATAMGNGVPSRALPQKRNIEDLLADQVDVDIGDF